MMQTFEDRLRRDCRAAAALAHGSVLPATARPARRRRGAILVAAAIILVVLALPTWLPSDKAGHQVPAAAAFGRTDLPTVSQPANLGFEDGLSQWIRSRRRGSVAASRLRPHSGQAAIRIAATSRARPSDRNSQWAVQCDATPGRYAGMRVRVRGWIRTADVRPPGFAGIVVTARSEDQQLVADPSSVRGAGAHTHWTLMTSVIDVPAEAVKLCYGAIVYGPGVAWADDFEVEVIGPAGQGPATTEKYPLPRRPRNTSFELADGPAALGWATSRTAPAFTHARDDRVAHSGTSSMRVRHERGLSFRQWTFVQQCLDATAYRGRRVEYSIWLRTEDVRGAVALTLGAGDGWGHASAGYDSRSRPVRGTTPWRRYTARVRVPNDAIDLCYGFNLERARRLFGLSATGTVWADDARLDVVDPSPRRR